MLPDKWNEMEEKSTMQRTKINWLRIGDDNNAFFHAYLKARGSVKSIQFLQKDDGTVLTDQKNIEDEFLPFYRNPMGKANNSTTHIDVEDMRSGMHIGNEHRDLLVGQVTTADI